MNIQNTVFTLLSFAVFLGLSVAYSTIGMAVADENGLYENIQLVMLAMAFVCAVVVAYQAKNSPLRYIGIGFILLTISFFIREFDLRGTDAPGILIFIGSPNGALYITLAMFIPYIVYSFRYLSFAWGAAIRFARTYHFARLMLVLLLLMIGGAYDREWLTSVHGMFYEEFYETLAWWLYAWALFKLTPAQMNFDKTIYLNPPNQRGLDV